ncbi:MAG: hypothetical protein QNJ31_07180 [Candidatus Caenarcaniphilales bacterium]|nr:hypothetical protein [Candidatus Caenarcaniphilales bacterium]
MIKVKYPSVPLYQTIQSITRPKKYPCNYVPVYGLIRTNGCQMFKTYQNHLTPEIEEWFLILKKEATNPLNLLPGELKKKVENQSLGPTELLIEFKRLVKDDFCKKLNLSEVEYKILKEYLGKAPYFNEKEKVYRKLLGAFDPESIFSLDLSQKRNGDLVRNIDQSRILNALEREHLYYLDKLCDHSKGYLCDVLYCCGEVLLDILEFALEKKELTLSKASL